MTAEEPVLASQVIEELPFKPAVQGPIYLVGSLGYMFDAWDVLLPSFVMPLLIPAMHLSLGAAAVFSSIGLAGMAVGAFAWGSIADVLGRKGAFTWTLLIYGIFSLATAAAPNYALLLVFRFLAGLGLGGCIPVDYTVVSEFMPRKYRGPLLTSVDVWWAIGGVLNGVVALALLPLHNWRLLFLVMVFPVILVAFIRRGIPESPVWLARKGRRDEARQVVDKLVAATHAPERAYTLPPVGGQDEGGVKEMLQKLPAIWRYNWKATLGLWLFFLIFYAEYFSVVSWVPTILVRAGYHTYVAYLFGTTLLVAGLVATIVISLLVNVTGRKWPMAVGAVLAAAFMVLFTMNLHVAGTARLYILGYGFFNEICAPVVYCYAPEMYPTLLRGSGFGWASTVSRVAAAVIPLLMATVLWPALGLTGSFTLMLAATLVIAVYFMLVNPETKNRPIDPVGTEERPLSIGQTG